MNCSNMFWIIDPEYECHMYLAVNDFNDNDISRNELEAYLRFERNIVFLNLIFLNL